MKKEKKTRTSRIRQKGRRISQRKKGRTEKPAAVGVPRKHRREQKKKRNNQGE